MKGMFALDRVVRRIRCCQPGRPCTTSGADGPNYLLITGNQKSSFSSCIITYVKISLGLVFGSQQDESLPVTSQSVQAAAWLGLSFTSLWYEALQVQDCVFASGVKTECWQDNSEAHQQGGEGRSPSCQLTLLPFLTLVINSTCSQFNRICITVPWLLLLPTGTKLIQSGSKTHY